MLSWNPGHVGAQQWSELKDWPRTEADSVCLLVQETHWSSTSQFAVAGWTCVVSASPKTPQTSSKQVPKSKGRKPKNLPVPDIDPQPAAVEDTSLTKADGVIVLLSPRINPGQIRWREHKIGRLLEVRFVFAGCPYVVLCVYQHVWSSSKSPQQNRKDRGSLLASLSKAVKQVPARTALVVAGDFNASLSPLPRLVGPSVCAASLRPDSEALQDLVAELKLVALNTWHASQPHTFFQNGSRSQINRFRFY